MRRQAVASSRANRTLRCPAADRIWYGFPTVGSARLIYPLGALVVYTRLVHSSNTRPCTDEWPQHWVRITRPFYLGKYEVSQEQYERVIGQNPSFFKRNRRRPVERVS